MIYKVQAYDPDKNTKFIYKFCKDDWVEFFTLDHKKGFITVRKELKYLAKLTSGDINWLEQDLELPVCVYDNDHREVIRTLRVGFGVRLF